MKDKILYWSPRILAILAILFVVLFSIDCFDAKMGLKEQLTCFVMHNIPAFMLLGILLISWKWEMIGGVLFCVIAVIGSFYFHAFGKNWGALIVLAPFVVTGILFIIHAVVVKQPNENTIN